MTYKWIEVDTVLTIHDIQIQEQGGSFGVREIGLIESALDKPKTLLSYGSPDIINLAAAYGYGYG